VSQHVQCRGLFDPGHHCPAVVCSQTMRGALGRRERPVQLS
jgi:hypothetical protein